MGKLVYLDTKRLEKSLEKSEKKEVIRKRQEVVNKYKPTSNKNDVSVPELKDKQIEKSIDRIYGCISRINKLMESIKDIDVQEDDE